MTAETPARPRPVPATVLPTSRRWPRLAAYGAVFGAAGLALLLPTSTAGAAWYFAGQLLDAEDNRPHPIRIREVTDGRVRLTRTDDLLRPMPLGLAWPGGHARLGDVVDVDRTTVVREVVHVSRGVLRPGVRAYSSGKVFDGDPRSARGLGYSEILIPGELGDLAAWFVPATGLPRDTWIIAVHGWKSSREDALRVLPVLAASGMPTLVVSYRNDAGAPASADRCHHLGHTEWSDVAAAVRYARTHGARDVVLYGWSMGGAIVLNLLRRAEEAKDVRAVVLDSPVIDWAETLRMHARTLRLPRAWLSTALWLVQHRLGVRLDDLDHRRYAADLRVPTLVFLDRDDRVVATAPTREFAARRPDLVTILETESCGHCHFWNRAPERYETALSDFLGSL
ncbi:MAG: alpha/beta fold hydrolase [Dactylosporangium sp.]|nr:alpha/beta fold hydrolase [Dactylosporangium sp.]NNJ63260.1 alpha/beta fold hydrolase [Dactylosporangium sp.]